MISLEGRTIIFKALSISRIVYLDCHSRLIDRRTSKNRENIYMTRPKISRKTLCNDFENSGLKHIHTSSKITSLQCFWLRKLCNENFHDEWKTRKATGFKSLRFNC